MKNISLDGRIRFNYFVRWCSIRKNDILIMPSPEVFYKHPETLCSKKYNASSLEHYNLWQPHGGFRYKRLSSDEIGPESTSTDTSNLLLTEFHDIIIILIHHGVKLPYRIIFSKSLRSKKKRTSLTTGLLINS